MTATLIKELDECIEIETKSGGTATTLATLRRAREALSAPGDAEREELARKFEAIGGLMSGKAEVYGYNFTQGRIAVLFSDLTSAAQLLRRPVEPVVTEEMIVRGADALSKINPTLSDYDVAEAVLDAALSQPAGGGK